MKIVDIECNFATHWNSLSLFFEVHAKTAFKNLHKKLQMF